MLNTSEKTMLVLPDFSPLAISLVDHKVTTELIINEYTNRLLINPHIPYSSGSNVLIIISEIIKPVTILDKPTANEIIPEYETLIPDNLITHF
jgi:hypothetical protein